MGFGARQPIERVEQDQRRALPGFGRAFVLYLLDRKAKGIDRNTRFVSQLIGHAVMQPRPFSFVRISRCEPKSA